MQLSYLGGAYGGFQVQSNAVTIQQTLQDALECVLGQRPPVTGCSRTDAGVHAHRYYCTTVIDREFDSHRLAAAINAHLPKDISVLGINEVDHGFHPRYTAIGKKYQYNIWLSPHRNVFLDRVSLHYPKKLNVDELISLATIFEGTYDFSAFQSKGSNIINTVRTVTSCSTDLNDCMLSINIQADGFLYNMARIMVGTLIEAASGRITDIAGILESCDRTKAGYTAPAHGLTLMQVYYPPGTTGFLETEIAP